MQQRSRDITIIGVPFRSGANRDGAQHAPVWLMEQLSLPLGNLLRFPSENMPLTDAAIIGVKNYDAVLQMRDKVKNEVAVAIVRGNKVVTIGGDHSIAMGSIAGVLEHYPNVGVIWFDAHTDINTEATSPSGNAHGMPLAALMGLCKSEINTQGAKLNPKNVYWVGARDIDDGEWDTIKRLGIEDHVFTAEKVHQIGMEDVMHHIREAFIENGVEQLHLSFDVDGMDPLIVPATGTPVETGLNENECDAFMEELTEDMPQLVSIDFVEYNPNMDDAQHITGKWCAHKLKELINIIQLERWN